LKRVVEESDKIITEAKQKALQIVEATKGNTKKAPETADQDIVIQLPQQ
jgi:vacuolar-type H+-ATPase subunit H